MYRVISHDGSETSPPPLRFYWNAPREGAESTVLVWKDLCGWGENNIRNTSKLTFVLDGDGFVARPN